MAKGGIGGITHLWGHHEALVSTCFSRAGGPVRLVVVAG